MKSGISQRESSGGQEGFLESKTDRWSLKFTWGHLPHDFPADHYKRVPASYHPDYFPCRSMALHVLAQRRQRGYSYTAV